MGLSLSLPLRVVFSLHGGVQCLCLGEKQEGGG